MRARLALLLVVLWTASAAAQLDRPPHPGDRAVGAWIGLSPDSPVRSRFGFGTTPGRQLLLVGARVEWVLETAGPLTLAATADLLPLAVLSHNPTYHTEKFIAVSGREFEEKTPTGEAPVFGAGLSPFGMKVYAGQVGRARLYGGGAVGALWFTRDTPVPDARRFNFTFEYGCGLEVARSPDDAVVLGYKFHHLSNANSARRNPGVDGNVIYVGVLYRR
jgi:opacity protein-like surface antigen